MAIPSSSPTALTDVDHINGARGDNRWANLRKVSRSVNLQNQRGARPGSVSGLLGVAPAPGGRWRASIRVNNTQTHLGYFADPNEAHKTYLKAKRKLHEGNTL